MLGQRIVTAVVLLALLIPALISDAVWLFTALTLAFMAAASWEWARLNGLLGVGAYVMAVLVVAMCAVTWMSGWLGWPGFWPLVAGLWLVGGAWALRVGPQGWIRSRTTLRWLLGVLLLWAAWWALVQAREQGLSFLMSVFVIVWVADVAAYVGGRTLRGPKLAPHISPGKTWSGALSGIAAVALLGWGWLQMSSEWGVLQSSIFHELVARFGTMGGLVALVGVISMSIVGDLFESLVKRAAGVKDSSGLLPGHGGVLDRIDALLPVFPLALALVS